MKGFTPNCRDGVSGLECEAQVRRVAELEAGGMRFAAACRAVGVAVGVARRRRKGGGAPYEAPGRSRERAPAAVAGAGRAAGGRGWWS